jgi:hypothetical protein
VYINEDFIQPPWFNGKRLDLQNAEEVNEFYQKWIVEENPSPVANLEQKISSLQERLLAAKDFERFRRGDMYDRK